MAKRKNLSVMQKKTPIKVTEGEKLIARLEGQLAVYKKIEPQKN